MIPGARREAAFLPVPVVASGQEAVGRVIGVEAADDVSVIVAPANLFAPDAGVERALVVLSAALGGQEFGRPVALNE